jgi:hypothetical protein
MDRMQLNTKIERALHKLINIISEHVYDFTHVYFMRRKEEIDRPTMERVLEVVKLAIADGFQSKIGIFNKEIDQALKEFTLEENPTIEKP